MTDSSRRVMAVVDRCEYRSTTVGPFQADSFHGIGSRLLPTHREWLTISYDAQHYEPMHLVRDGNFIPPIFKCLGHLIVAEEVKASIEHFPYLRFVEVAFDKLVDAYVAKGDFSLHQTGIRDSRQHILNAVEVPQWKRTVGRWFEVVIPRQMDVANRFTPEKRILCDDRKFGEGSPEEALQLSSAMLAAFPLFWHEGWHIVREALYRKLEPHLDFDYFTVEALEY